MFPQDVHNLVMRMYDDQPLFDLYYKHYYKSYLDGRTCVGECRDNMLCNMRTAIAGAGCPTG